VTAKLTEARGSFHRELIEKHTLSFSPSGVASNADKQQVTSVKAASSIADTLGADVIEKKLDGQKAGRQFEEAVHGFLQKTFPLFQSLRPGNWEIKNVGGSRNGYQISKYEPYRHLAYLADVIKNDKPLASALGNSYEISPDILVLRSPEPDGVINSDQQLVDSSHGTYSIIRQENQKHQIVHAMISCKWTLRSDRAQNARSEALNIIRNRKGRTPHIAVVTGEPSPSRLSSLALGTGDIDTVYHFALPELVEGIEQTGNDEAIDMLGILIDGKRLRDISDLALDLAV